MFRVANITVISTMNYFRDKSLSIILYFASGFATFRNNITKVDSVGIGATPTNTEPATVYGPTSTRATAKTTHLSNYFFIYCSTCVLAHFAVALGVIL